MSAPDFRDTAKCGQLPLTAVTVGRRRNSALAAPVRTGKRLAGRPRRAPGLRRVDPPQSTGAEWGNIRRAAASSPLEDCCLDEKRSASSQGTGERLESLAGRATGRHDYAS